MHEKREQKKIFPPRNYCRLSHLYLYILSKLKDSSGAYVINSDMRNLIVQK